MTSTASTHTVALLNRLFQTVCRSLPMYLAEAADPWMHAGDEKAKETLNNIVADQRAFAARIADRILDIGTLDAGVYPMEFTDTHFLALDFLIGELIKFQRRDVGRIERIVDLLHDDYDARELAEETLGAERAHLEMLEELGARR
jgi:hypothetical protein